MNFSRGNLRPLLLAITLLGCGIISGSAIVSSLPAIGFTAILMSGLIILRLVSQHSTQSLPNHDPISADIMKDRNRLRLLVDHSPVPMVTLSGDNQCDAANRSARKLFKTESRLLDPPEALIKLLKGEKDVEGQRIWQAPDGRQFAIAVTNMSDMSGHLAIGALLDIQAELDVVQMKTLRELMQIVSHEIMGALTPIASLSQSVAEIAQEERPDLAAVREATETIARRARGLEGFCNSYRSLARLPSPIQSPLQINELLDDIVRLFEARYDAGVQLHFVRPNNSLRFLGDQSQLTIALWGIMQNAAEAAVANDQRKARVSLEIYRLVDGFTISISDTGNGVEEKFRNNIFQPFFTMKKGGSGVGLTLAKQIILSHGGSLSVKPATMEYGGRFEIKLKQL